MLSDHTYEEALRADSPHDALRSQVVTLHQRGHAKVEIVAALERLILRLRSEGRAEDEEIVADVLDALGGWCHPSHRLLPEDEAIPPA